MFKHYFERIEQVEIWPIISLMIFFIFFICLLIYVFKIDRNYVREVSQLPMDDAGTKPSNETES